MTMPHTHRQLVKSNIEALGDDINIVSQIFYRELFHIDIKLKTVFSGNVIFLNRKFSNMLGTFKNVTHLEKISASIEQMGARHIQQYKAELQHFPSVQQALILALKEYFSTRFSPEIENAWNSVFQEVAEIMKNAMKKMGKTEAEQLQYDEKGYDVNLLSEVNGEQGITEVHRRFYDVMFDEPWLGQFFYGKSKEALIHKQTQFMVAAFGGKNNYNGDTPAFVHMHMYITDEMIALRQQVLRQVIFDEGYNESVAERWLKVDASFNESIVKNSVEECVLKCRGQMPITAKKPQSY